MAKLGLAAERSIEVRLLGTPAWRLAGDPDWRLLQPRAAALFGVLAFDGPQPALEVAVDLWPAADFDDHKAAGSLRQLEWRLRKLMTHPLFTHGRMLTLAPGVRVDAADLLGGKEVDSVEPPYLKCDFGELSHRLQEILAGHGGRWRQCQAQRLEAQSAASEIAGDIEAAVRKQEQLRTLLPGDERVTLRLLDLHLKRQDPAAYDTVWKAYAEALRVEGRLPSRDAVRRHDTDRRMLGSAGSPMPVALRSPPFVGRVLPLARMSAAWDQGKPFLLVGEAGVGKSRLLEEFCRTRSGVLTVVNTVGDKHEAYSTMARLLRPCVQTYGRPTEERHLQSLTRILPELGSPVTGHGSESMVQLALEDTLRNAHARGLRALVIDNLHHADEASLQALERLVHSGTGLQLGLATRPRAHQKGDDGRLFADSTDMVQIPLGALTVDELRELLCGLDIDGLDSHGRAAELLRHCGGNPFLVMQTLRELWLQGDLDGPLPVSSDGRRLVLQRLDSVGTTASLLLQLASLAGADFTPQLAMDALDLDLPGLEAAWHDLTVAGLFNDQGLAHDIVREAVRASMAAPARCRMQGVIGRVLLQSELPPDRVARYFVDAQLWADAASLLEAAAARAGQLGRLSQSLGYLREAADCHRKAGAPGRAQQAECRALLPRLMLEDPGRAAEEARRLRLAATTAAERAAIDAESARISLWGGDLPGAEHAARSALMCQTAGRQTHVLARIALGVALGWSDRREESHAVFEPMLVDAASIGDESLREGLWAGWGFVLAHEEAWPQAEHAVRRSLAIAQGMGDTPREADALANLAAACLGQGRAAEALEYARDATKLHKAMGKALGERNNELNVAAALIALGHYGESLSLLQSVLEFAQGSAQSSLYRLVAQDLMAEGLIAIGRADLAQAQIDEEAPSEVPIRGLVRCELRARAAALVDARQASTMWRRAIDLAESQPANRTRRLRTLLNASTWVAPETGLRWCQEGMSQAAAMDSRVLMLLARLRRAQCLLAQHHYARAADEAREAMSLACTVRHAFVHVPEVYWCAYQAFHHQREGAAAMECIRKGGLWLEDMARRHVPEHLKDAFLERPVHRDLLAKYRSRRGTRSQVDALDRRQRPSQQGPLQELP